MFVYGKITSFFCFFCMDKDRTLTYWKLIGFVASYTFLGFLDIRLFLGLSLIPIPLDLRNNVTSRLKFYQTWFFTFRVVIYFIGGYLTMWSRGSHQLVLELGSKNQVISFIFFLLISASLALVVFDLVFYYFMSRA